MSASFTIVPYLLWELSILSFLLCFIHKIRFPTGNMYFERLPSSIAEPGLGQSDSTFQEFGTKIRKLVSMWLRTVSFKSKAGGAEMHILPYVLKRGESRSSAKRMNRWVEWKREEEPVLWAFQVLVPVLLKAPLNSCPWVLKARHVSLDTAGFYYLQLKDPSTGTMLNLLSYTYIYLSY